MSLSQRGCSICETSEWVFSGPVGWHPPVWINIFSQGNKTSFHIWDYLKCFKSFPRLYFFYNCLKSYNFFRIHFYILFSLWKWTDFTLPSNIPWKGSTLCLLNPVCFDPNVLLLHHLHNSVSIIDRKQQHEGMTVSLITVKWQHLVLLIWDLIVCLQPTAENRFVLSFGTSQWPLGWPFFLASLPSFQQTSSQCSCALPIPILSPIFSVI